MSEGGAGLRASLSPLYLLRFACMCGERQGEREGTKEARERDNGDGEPAAGQREAPHPLSCFSLAPGLSFSAMSTARWTTPQHSSPTPGCTPSGLPRASPLSSSAPDPNPANPAS